jgi:hypothetical protein
MQPGNSLEHSLGERLKQAASHGNLQQVQGVVFLTTYGFPRCIRVDRAAM